MEKRCDKYVLGQWYLSGDGCPNGFPNRSWGIADGEGGIFGGRNVRVCGVGNGFGSGHGDGECSGSICGDGNLHESGFSISAMGGWQDPCIK